MAVAVTSRDIWRMSSELSGRLKFDITVHAYPEIAIKEGSKAASVSCHESMLVAGLAQWAGCVQARAKRAHLVVSSLFKSTNLIETKLAVW